MSLSQQAAGLLSTMARSEELCYCNFCLVSPPCPACCLTGSPWVCLSLQPTRPLLFLAQCYVLLSKYVRWCGGGVVCTSVCQSDYFTPCRGESDRAVFSDSLSISQISKELSCCAELARLLFYVLDFFLDTLHTNKQPCRNAGYDASLTAYGHLCNTLLTFLDPLCKQKPLMVAQGIKLFSFNKNKNK